MAEALISVLIEELGSIALQWVEEEVRLVKDAEKDIGQLKSNLQDIQAVLEDAEEKQLTDRHVGAWLEKLKDASFEMDNVLDEWNTAFLKFKIQKEFEQVPVDEEKKVCCPVPSPFSCFTSKVNRFTLRHEIAHKIKDLNKRLDVIAAEKDRYNLNTTVAEQPVVRPETTSFIDDTEIYGRDEEKEMVISKLCENSTNQDQGLVIIPIVGFGGMGKTALAQLIYNDEKVKAHFDKLIWVCVPDPFDVTKVATAIIEEVEGQAPNNKTLQSVMKGVLECIQGKRFLLVLDDVWTKDSGKWGQLKQPLRSGAVGSRILVTTRKKSVAVMMGVAENQMISLEKLSEENSWLVFKRWAFLGRKEEDCKKLEEIGHKIASKSKGLPLVAKTLGSLMCFKNISQWEDVLRSELWKLRDKDEVFAPFLLSYNDLFPKEKRCFLYCSIFPKDYWISRNELIDLWFSQSYLKSEEDGQECFENLVMRSFFQNCEKRSNDGRITHCKMHDIVHDFCQFLTRTEYLTMEVGNAEEELNTLERARHLTLVVGPDAKFPTLKYHKMNEQNIRSLFLQSYFTTVDGSLFLPLKCLRTLNLAFCKLEKLPESIGSLMQLRYLSLECNWTLKELPDTLCDLCNLQTLKLRSCRQLKRLPEGIGKLVKLRHLNILYCDALEGLPKGIGRLTGLERLDMLVIPEAEVKEAFFDVGNFKMLRKLRTRGALHVKGCRNAGNEEVVEILDLKNSLQFSNLTLDFGIVDLLNRYENDGAVLELFEPHQDLVWLTIYRYGATTVSPRWMMSLTNLREISLSCCNNCEILPSLGKLPSLEIINLTYLWRLKKVGVEFLGITEKRDEEEGNGAMKRADSSRSPIISFPKLKTINFTGLSNWETWEASTVVTETSAIIMPCLTRLLFEGCPSLQALPGFLAKTTSLKELVISSSEILEQWYQRSSGEEWAKIQIRRPYGI